MSNVGGGCAFLSACWWDPGSTRTELLSGVVSECPQSSDLVRQCTARAVHPGATTSDDEPSNGDKTSSLCERVLSFARSDRRPHRPLPQCG